MKNSRMRVWLVAIGTLAMLVGVVALGTHTWAQEATTTPPTATPPSNEEQPIELHLRDCPIDSALKALFRETPYGFVIDPGVTGRVNTLELTDQSFATALRTLLNSVTPKLTYRKEGEIYYISQAQEPTVSPVLENTQQAAEQQVYWIGPGGRYELQYLDCRDVAVWFGGRVTGQTPQIPTPIGGNGTNTVGGSPSAGMSTPSMGSSGFSGSTGGSTTTGNTGGNNRGGGPTNGGGR